MNSIVISTISIGILGLIFGAVLAYAAKKLKIDVDARIEKINEILPGVNCGACGYAGCMAYAKVIVLNGVPIISCAPGGKDVSVGISELMGVSADDSEELVAYVHCRGDKETVKKTGDYKGILTCTAVHNTTGGDKACVYGCLGYGDCEKACPWDAIKVQEDGIPVVDRDKCIGCGLCVQACPRNIIDLVPKTAYIFIKCVSPDFGAKVSKVCKKGCIGCSLCVKEYDSQGIEMQGKLPVIDYKSFKGDQSGVEKCPPKVIEFIDEIYKKNNEKS